VNVEGVEELVADKGYHAGPVLAAVREAGVRTYVAEPDRGRRKWTGKEEQQAAVYANRRRIGGNPGKQLLRRRCRYLATSPIPAGSACGLSTIHSRRSVWLKP